MLDKEAKWATGPFKMPDLDAYSAPSVEVADLKGTYKAEGCPLLHIVGVNDEVCPPKFNTFESEFYNKIPLVASQAKSLYWRSGTPTKRT